VNAYQIKPGELAVPKRTERNERYLAFLRLLPCINCAAPYSVEAAHFGPHGISQKASDLDALPLCRRCHRTGMRSYHTLGPRDFAKVHDIDVRGWIETFNRFWEERLERLTRIRREDLEQLHNLKKRNA
jgi:hypothetical protein